MCIRDRGGDPPMSSPIFWTFRRLWYDRVNNAIGILVFLCQRSCKLWLCALFVCTVTDYSTENAASGVKFCTAVHRHPRQGISHFVELCSPTSPKSDESASAPPHPRRSHRLPFGCRMHDRAQVWICRIGMCGYAAVPGDMRTFVTFICYL